MASKKAASKSSAASDTYTGPITRSRSKGIIQGQDQGSAIAQSILKQLMESPKAGIVIKENPLYNDYDSASSRSLKEAHPDVMSVMMADVAVETAMAEMERKINLLMKVVDERDHEIAALKEQMQTRETAESSQTPVVKVDDKGKNVVQENQPQQQSTSVASLSVQQLQDMITSSIRAQYGGPSQTSFMYSKPYTKRIDNLRMPLGYQPPKFQQFDGKGNPKQHVAHFVETCENAGSRGDQLVRQFVRSLKGNAFEWYTDLEPESIESWEQLEKEFLNRFYSTRRTVSMMELTNTKQRKGEPVIDYINRWRALSLDCKDRLTELSAVEMCTQGMHWGLLYILQGIKPRTFEELATRAHDMELSIASRGTKDFLVPEVKKDKKEMKGAEKIVKSTAKESMVVNTTPLKFSKGKEARVEKKDDGSERRRLTLKERQEKVYPFPDSDIADMLEQLLEKQLIQLPECKRPEQAGKVDDPNYCKYHRVISHPVEKCFVLKELILRLAREKRIELDLEEVAQTNHAEVTIMSEASSSRLIFEQRKSLVQFGTFEPIVVQFFQEISYEDPQGEKRPIEEDDEGWIVVTHRKKRQSIPTQRESRSYQNYRRGNKTQKNKKKKKTHKLKLVHNEDMNFSRPQRLVTLADFLPKSFLCDHQDEDPEVVACHAINTTEEEIIPPRSLEGEGVSKDLSRFNVEDLLSLPQETKTILIDALLNSRASSSSTPTMTYESGSYCMSIDFSDEDLLLGSKLHNRPLYVSGYVREQRVDRILIDNGSAVNIMPKSTMWQLGILMDELSNSKLVIQGFNQGSQRAIGMIRLELIIGDLKASALFHVIDSRTTYKLLLGRPWIHGNGVVTSTLHQCFKFYQDGVKKVEADSNPFSEAESHFADAKFYSKNNNILEVLPAETPLTKGEDNSQLKSLATTEPHESARTFNSGKGEAYTSSTKGMILKDENAANTPVLRYVPLSRRKKGESPFMESPKGLKVGDIEIIKESFTTPLTKIAKQEVKVDLVEANLPQRRTKDGFDPKAYKLMAKAGYDFTAHTEFKSLEIHDRPELSSTQKKLLREGHSIPVSRKGLGYKSPEPIRITKKGKEKVVDINHITIEEDDNTDVKEGDNQRISVFDRIRPSVARPVVFERLSMTEAERERLQSVPNLERHSVFRRLTTTPIKEESTCHALTTTRPSAFERLGVSKKKNVQAPRAPIFNHLGDKGSHDNIDSNIDTKKKEPMSRVKVWRRIKHTDVENYRSKKFPCETKENGEIHSNVPSRMKRKTFVTLNTSQGSLKVKRHDVILTNPEKEGSEQGECETSCHHITIIEESETGTHEEDAENAPQSLEDGGQSTVDELKEVNLGTIEEPRPTFISASLSNEEVDKYMSLLTEYRDIFAWSYKEMPGLDPKVAVHHLAIKPGYRPIKQAQRRFRPELIPQIEVEVNKLIEAGFIREVKYPTWIANIVPVRKKNGQLRVCVDFRDLNNACPKDDFPLPITEIMVDATTGHEALSFMDGSSGYNQIRMALSDEEMTAFRTPKGIYCYKVMPFGLKNAGATYQRAMQKVFDDMLHRYVECYVDDLVVKTKRRQDHLKDLKVVFDRLRKYQLRMNPLKCAFGVTSGKFLGFIVRHRGIEIDQSKIDAIQKMSRPKSLHDLRSLQGRLAYIRRFISNLAGRCQPFQKLMRKGENFVWDEACQNAFDSIKKYLLTPPVLGAPVPDKPLILYIAAQERSLGALLAQEEVKGKERSLYYLSRTLIGAEVNYSPIEKMCLALFFAIDKLRHYMQAFTVHLVAKADPIKYVLSRPIIAGRLAKWAVLLQQYDIVYIPQKAIKGQALADFLADHPIPSDWKLCDDLPDDEVFFTEVMEPWTMYFDGAARRSGAGAGIVLISPEKHMLPYSFALSELCSNNVAEYQALIIGLQIALEIGVSFIEVYGDSKLIINQLSLQYDVKHEDLKPYFAYARQLMEKFDNVMLEHVPRVENKRADALANLATALTMPDDVTLNIPLCQRWIIPPVRPECQEVNMATSYLIDEEDWRQPIIEYLEHGKLPKDSRHKIEIRRRAAHFIYYKGTLYRRSLEGLFLRCLGKEDSVKALKEVHAGVCGAHQSGPKLQFQLRRMGYYWPKMIQDSIDYVKKCEPCQYHANFIHQPPEPLHPTVASWPFEAWGLDLVGPITPKSSAGHSYILAATDYFSRWAEAISLREAKKENVADFIRTHIIYRYGIPHRIVTDNGKQFSNSMMDKLCEKFKFKQYKSSMYNAAANGLAEAFNKTLCNLLKKIVSKSKRDWQEKIGEALWAYRTTHRTPTGVTPYSLVYGVEAVLPLEREIPSLRMAVQEGLTTEDNVKLRLQELEALDEKRLEAQQALECYQARMSKAFDKHVKPRSFQVGDLVLAVRRPIITTRHTGNKFTPKWDGPYIVKEVYTNGAYKIVDQDGLRIGPINGKFLKKFYA